MGSTTALSCRCQSMKVWLFWAIWWLMREWRTDSWTSAIRVTFISYWPIGVCDIRMILCLGSTGQIKRLFSFVYFSVCLFVGGQLFIIPCKQVFSYKVLYYLSVLILFSLCTSSDCPFSDRNLLSQYRAQPTSLIDAFEQRTKCPKVSRETWTLR